MAIKRWLWICSECDMENYEYGACRGFACPGKQDPPQPKEKKVPQVNTIVQKIEVPKFRTIYDVIFALVAQGAILTGSRAFGFEHAGSDWDFVIGQDARDGGADVWTEFREVSIIDPSENYKDTNTVRVLKGRRFDIHVQVSRNIAQKLAAQELLLSMPEVMQISLLKSMNKTKQRKVWDWALAQVGGKN